MKMGYIIHGSYGKIVLNIPISRQSHAPSSVAGWRRGESRAGSSGDSEEENAR